MAKITILGTITTVGEHAFIKIALLDEILQDVGFDNDETVRITIESIKDG